MGVLEHDAQGAAQVRLFYLVDVDAVIADFPPLRSPDLCYISVEGCSPLSFGVAYLRGDRSQTLRRFLAILEQTVTVAPDPGI